MGLSLSEGLGFTGRQEQSHGYVINVAPTAEVNPLLEAPLFGEAQLEVERDGRFVFRANQEFDLVTIRLCASPGKKCLQQALSVTLAPVAQVDTHIQSEYVRHLPQTHGPQACVSNKPTFFFDDEILAFAARDRSESFDEVRFGDFIGF